MTDDELIVRYIADHGVTRCPPMYAAPTTASREVKLMNERRQPGNQHRNKWRQPGGKHHRAMRYLKKLAHQI